MTDPDDYRQTILIVDDVPANIRVLDQLLKGAYDIRAAIQGTEAIEIAKSADPPDLILLDIVMPEMDGYEVCRRLKADVSTRHIPVIFITSRSEAAEETRGFEMGAMDYITKPFSPDIVRARVKTQMDLKRYRDHLRGANAKLRHELKKQEINIDLAKKLLGLVNRTAIQPRRVPLGCDLSLFVDILSAPCHAEGGDHCFIRPVDANGGKTFISIKDQSGHEVGCVLRSIITDLSHNRIIDSGPTLKPGTLMARLNKEVCRSGLLSPENFFTAIVAELDHTTLEFRYVSAGHPPMLLVRGDAVSPLPAPGEPGANIPVGVAEHIPYQEGVCRLLSGDRLILYTDGLTEMPLAKGRPMIESATLVSIARDMVQEERDAGRGDIPASVLMRRLLNHIAELSDETVIPADAPDGPKNTSEDDVTLLCLEVEDNASFVETVWQPQNSEELGKFINDLCRNIMAQARERGFGVSEHVVRTALAEAAVNAWRHGNQSDPEKNITIRLRYGNDLHIDVIDQGEGFDCEALPDPTMGSNLTKTNGRGVFLIRHLADEAEWKNCGHHAAITFYRRHGGDEVPDGVPEDDAGDPGTHLSTERNDAMEMTVARQGEKARFTITGRIDENGAETLKRKFREVNDDHLKEVVFDFRNVIHIGSAGIGKLLLFYKDLALKDGCLKIDNASHSVHELFTVLKLDTIIDIKRV